MSVIFTGMIFRQLLDPTSSTYTYLLADEASKEAVLIDTVYERHERDAALLRELGLTLLYTIDTHCHADHVTGAWLMKVVLGSQVALSVAVEAANVDRPLQHGEVIRFGKRSLEVRATPGHTSGCITLVLDDHSMAFTGDCLMIRSAGRTDFQQGDAHRMFRSIREQIFSLPDECAIYPAHDYEGRTSSTVREEREHNPRIGGGAREEDFVGYMENLGLPHPKQIEVAVPANLRSGRPEHDLLPKRAEWGPAVTTYGGILEVDPEWVARHRSEVHLLDVRAAVELEGDLGKLTGTQHIPLAELRQRLDEVPRDKPVLTVCQTGRRSAMATTILRKAGIERTANVAGGMVRWRQNNLPELGRSSAGGHGEQRLEIRVQGRLEGEPSAGGRVVEREPRGVERLASDGLDGRPERAVTDLLCPSLAVHPDRTGQGAPAVGGCQ